MVGFSHKNIVYLCNCRVVDRVKSARGKIFWEAAGCGLLCVELLYSKGDQKRVLIFDSVYIWCVAYIKVWNISAVETTTTKKKYYWFSMAILLNRVLICICFSWVKQEEYLQINCYCRKSLFLCFYGFNSWYMFHTLMYSSYVHTFESELLLWSPLNILMSRKFLTLIFRCRSGTYMIHAL